MKKIFYVLFVAFSFYQAKALPLGYSFDTTYIGGIYNLYYKNNQIISSCLQGVKIIDGDSVRIIADTNLRFNYGVIKDSLLYCSFLNYSGIKIIDLNTFLLIKTLTTENSNLKNNYVAHLDYDKKGNIWFGYMNWAYLGKYDGDSITNYLIPETFNTTSDRELFVDDSDIVWFKNDDNFSFVKFDGLTFSKIDYTNSPLLNHGEEIRQAYYSRNRKEIWLLLRSYGPYINRPYVPINRNRVFKIKNGVWTEMKELYPYINSSSLNAFYWMMENWRGEFMFLGGSDYKASASILLFDTLNSIKKISIPSPIKYSKTADVVWNLFDMDLTSSNKLFLDGLNPVLVDLNIYDNKLDTMTLTKINTAWSYIPRNNDVLNDILEIKQGGGKLFAICSYGIDAFDGSKWTRIDDKSINLPMKAFRLRGGEIIGDSLYATGIDGLLRVNINDLSDVKYYDYKNSNLNDCWHHNIVKDYKNNLWFTSDSAELIKYDGANFTHIAIPASIPKPYNMKIKGLTIDDSNNVYYSSLNNIIKYDGVKWTVFDTTNSLLFAYDIIDLIYYSKIRHELIVATDWTSNNKYQRLLRFKNGVWDSINYQDTSLYYKYVAQTFYNATEDSAGNIYFCYNNLYMPTGDDIMVLKPDYTWLTIKNGSRFNYYFGINTKCMYVDDENTLWAGGEEVGLCKYDVKSLMGVEDETNVGAFIDLWIFNIYPNPISKNSVVDFFCMPASYPDLKIRLYNVLGEEIAEVKGDITYNSSDGKGTAKLKLDGVPAGYYLLNLSAKGENRTKGVVVE